ANAGALSDARSARQHLTMFCSKNRSRMVSLCGFLTIESIKTEVAKRIALWFSQFCIGLTDSGLSG
ncbi:MAG: hypothetical protein ACI4SA_04990, partial [Lachnospiraceae bacterium]